MGTEDFRSAALKKGKDFAAGKAPDPKAFLLKKVNGYLNVATGTVSGVFAGNAWATVKGFLRDPEYYLSRPGAWYKGLIVSGVITALLVAGIGIAKKVLRDRLGVDLESGEINVSGKSKTPANKAAAPVKDTKSAASGSSPAEAGSTSETPAAVSNAARKTSGSNKSTAKSKGKRKRKHRQ